MHGGSRPEYIHARNSPSRQRRREHRVAARGAAVAHGTAEEAEHKAAAEDVAGFLPNVAEKAYEKKASTKQDQTAEANSNVNYAAKTSTVRVVFSEPSDEIENLYRKYTTSLPLSFTAQLLTVSPSANISSL
jgi:hypothetical protein